MATCADCKINHRVENEGEFVGNYGVEIITFESETQHIEFFPSSNFFQVIPTVYAALESPPSMPLWNVKVFIQIQVIVRSLQLL